VYAWHERFTTNLDGVFNVQAKVKNRWRSPEQPGNGKIPTSEANTVLAREGDTRWVYDASYIKMENVTLGYNIPASYLGKVGFIKSTRIYTSIQNALMFTAYPG